jgi:hypothetical protein
MAGLRGGSDANAAQGRLLAAYQPPIALRADASGEQSARIGHAATEPGLVHPALAPYQGLIGMP